MRLVNATSIAVLLVAAGWTAASAQESLGVAEASTILASVKDLKAGASAVQAADVAGKTAVNQDSGAPAQGVDSLSKQVSDILGEIAQLQTTDCGMIGDINDAICGSFDDQYNKSSVDTQTAIALSMAQEMIKNGQLQLAAEAIGAIKTQSQEYHGGIAPYFVDLYSASQVGNIVDMAVRVINAAQNSSAAK